MLPHLRNVNMRQHEHKHRIRFRHRPYARTLTVLTSLSPSFWERAQLGSRTMSAQALLHQLTAFGLVGADDTSADSVASSQVNASASGQVNASEDEQAASARRARAAVQLHARRRLCWRMCRRKNERTAMRQLQSPCRSRTGLFWADLVQ